MTWDVLPHADWQPTIRSLHRWSQMHGAGTGLAGWDRGLVRGSDMSPVRA